MTKKELALALHGEFSRVFHMNSIEPWEKLAEFVFAKLSEDQRKKMDAIAGDPTKSTTGRACVCGPGTPRDECIAYHPCWDTL